MNDPKNEQQPAPNNRKLMRQSTLMSLIGIAIVALATVYIVSHSPSIKTHYESGIKPGSDPHLTLAAFSQNKTGLYEEVNSLLEENRQVIFKASTTIPIHVALLKSTNNSSPNVVFDTLIPPGENRLLEKAGDKYIYTINKEDKSLRFCVIYAEKRNQLITQLQNLDKVWAEIPATACLKLT